MNTDVAGELSGFEVLFYNNPQPMWIFDIYTLCIVEVNDAAVNRYGYSKTEFLEKTIHDLRPFEDIAEVNKVLNEIQGHNTNHREFKHVAKNGAVLHVSITSYVITYKGKRVRLVHAHNIDEQKSIVKQLKTTSNKLEHMLENTTIGFCQIDNNWQIIYWNHAAEVLIGYKREHVLGRNIWAVLPELQQTFFYLNCNKAYDEGINIESVEYFWPVQKWFSIAVYPAEDGLNIHFRDSTHKKLFEESLLSKIEQLKEISFFNSHYIRKPVASLLGLTYLINADMVHENELKKIAGYIHESGKELDKVLKTMNDIVNDDTVAYLSYELNEFCFNEMLNTLIEELQQKYTQNPLLLKGRAGILYYGNKKAIQIAIECMIDNAVKFSAPGLPVHLHINEEEKSLVITVQDFGMGMSQQTVNGLFECFYQKKADGWLGTGLSKVIDIARKHNGCLWVESKLNEGAVFKLQLPISNIAAYKITGEPDFSVYKLPEIQLQYNYTLNYLQANWMGFHNANSVTAKCIALTKALRQSKAQRLLINATNLQGVWEGAVEWLVNEWLPQIEKGGLQKMAVVYSTSTFTKLSATNVQHRNRSSIEVESFNTKEEALQWLLGYTDSAFENQSRSSAG